MQLEEAKQHVDKLQNVIEQSIAKINILTDLVNIKRVKHKDQESDRKNI